ncbi:hypothetical protein FH972_024895 [Carpinus fangiana]|uniref:Uncharacterized protein n=1 Tax=Carpinus fangiana TaxID=176857 RepID=A0A5N6L1X6_9ROSI|nr:hypothetical protein FH972_024895 [Carpinus fangiana]
MHVIVQVSTRMTSSFANANGSDLIATGRRKKASQGFTTAPPLAPLWLIQPALLIAGPHGARRQKDQPPPALREDRRRNFGNLQVEHFRADKAIYPRQRALISVDSQPKPPAFHKLCAMATLLDEQSSSRTHQRKASGASKKRSTAKSSDARRDPNKSHTKSSSARNSIDFDEDPMGATFLQFCATCEKQIAVPNSSVLYCSEECKSSDATRTTSYPLFKTDSTPPPSPRRSPVSGDLLDHDVVPQRSPTQPSAPFSHRASISDAAALDGISPGFYILDSQMRRDHSSSSLSTLSRSGTPRSRPSSGRADTEAAAYLQQFHSPGRPYYSRSSTSNTVPSLSHTPVSHVGTSIPYTPSSSTGGRPPPRAHTSFSSKSIDLVTPITAQEQADYDTSNVASVASDDTIRAGFEKLAVLDNEPTEGMTQQQLSYEKQTMKPRGFGSSSLKQLFEFEQMRR